MASNGILTAMAWTQASSIAVWGGTDFKRFDANIPLIKGHQGAVTDLMFSPFHNNLLASSSEDGKVKLWVIPDGGLTQHLKEEDMCLTGHSKKALSVRWHNSVENLMSTGANDNTVKIWDVSCGKMATNIPVSNAITSQQWSPKGNTLALMVKGSIMSLVDPRNAENAWQQPSHQGSKAQKLQWIDDDHIVSSGFNKMNEREWAVWDIRQQGQGPIGTG